MTQPSSPVPAAQPRAPLGRGGGGQVLAGVAVGLAAHLGLPVRHVRIGFVVLALLSGAGLIIYGLLWVLMPPAHQVEAAGLEAASRRGLRKNGAGPVQGPDPGQLFSGGMVLLGLLWLCVSGGVIPAGLFWPVVLGGVGVVVIWLQVDQHVMPQDTAGRGWWGSLTHGGGVMSVLRLLGGLVLVGVGISWFLATQVGLAELPGVLGASGVLLAGVLVVTAPWLYQQRGRVRRAEVDKVRAQARADMAAHLHDSVLQTLALIQRQANDPGTVTNLARRQERELRTWLYGETTTRAASLRSALREVSTDVEADFAIDVELVCVGDTSVGDRVQVLVQAAKEAMINAAKHSGAPRVDVYAEAEEGRVEVFVRDRGRGFDPESIGEGRLGVRQSIKARMERHGGKASLRSQPGEGTEVRLEIST